MGLSPSLKHGGRIFKERGGFKGARFRIHGPRPFPAALRAHPSPVTLRSTSEPAELSADPVARLKQRLVLSAVLLDRIQAAATHLGSEVLTNEMQIAFLLARLQNTGICFDLSYNKRSERKVSERLAHLNRRAESIAGKAINLRSAKQVGDVLYDKLGYTVPSKKGTARTSQRRTDEETLKALEKEGEEAGKPPLPAIVLESRKLSQYLAKWVNAP